MILPRSFYERHDVVLIARELLGKFICTQERGIITAGMICETEAYEGITDRASHAYGGRRTGRTEIMYASGGTAYIYLCYGIHSLFNVVTNRKEIPHAVLIRGIVPSKGLETMLNRTGKKKVFKEMGIGPGKVARLLGIHYSQTGADLTKGERDKAGFKIWIEDRGLKTEPGMIETGPRIGVQYAGPDALLPNRFQLRQ
ncbi:MAG: DNA-3-methyladenine glycosylase [bacterium]